MIFIPPSIPRAPEASAPVEPKSRLLPVPEPREPSLPAVLPAHTLTRGKAGRKPSPHKRRESMGATAHMEEEAKLALELLPEDGGWVSAFDVYRALLARFPGSRDLIWRLFTSLTAKEKMRQRRLHGVLYFACAQPHLDPATSSRRQPSLPSGP